MRWLHLQPTQTDTRPLPALPVGVESHDWYRNIVNDGIDGLKEDNNICRYTSILSRMGSYQSVKNRLRMSELEVS